MADYYAQTRSNYFKVKDEAAFRRWAVSRELKVRVGDGEHVGLLAITSNGPNAGDWCRSLYDEATGKDIEVDFEREISGHLQDGSVAVLMELGSAVAINSRGQTVAMDLAEIYQLAEALGGEVTKVER